MALVSARRANGGDPMIVLLEPGMVRSSLIPQWMTEPAAATLCIHTPPRISHDCLLALREVIDTVLGLTGEDLRAPVQANDPDPNSG